MVKNKTNQQITQQLLKQKEKILKGTLDTKRSFFSQSSYLYSFSMNDLLSIYSQKKSVTDLRTFDEWKKVNRFILSGEKAIFLLDNYSDPYSKRTALFDVTQTSGATIEKTKYTKNEVSKLIDLLVDSPTHTISTEDKLHDFLEYYAEKGLKHYTKLTNVEKEMVPLLSEYSLLQRLELPINEKLSFQLEERFLKNERVRYIPTLQVANNMSSTIMQQFSTNLSLAKEQLKLVEQSMNTTPEKELQESTHSKISIPIDSVGTDKENEDHLLNDFESDSLQQDKEDTQELPEKVQTDILTENHDEPTTHEVSLFDLVEDPHEESLKPNKKETYIDFSFDKKEEPYSKGIVRKIEENITAVELVKSLEKEERVATLEEQMVLARYSGWGGIANELFDIRKDRFSSERRRLQMLLTPDEYRLIEDSSLTSYYTDPRLIEALWDKLEEAGFTGGTVLDPAMGTGNFFSAMPVHLKSKSVLYGVEIDQLTGQIAKNLHQSANIQIKGFEETQFSDSSFDVVVGNVPFTNLTLSDGIYKNMMIHDYFFKKSMDLVREGGILAFITSTGTMDKADIRLRESLSKEATLIAGFRLPNNAFRVTANTDVTSDLLIFQKKTKQQLLEPYECPTWVKGAQSETTPNNYFVEHPTNVLGELFTKNFNGQTLSVKATEDYLKLFDQKVLPLTYKETSIKTPITVILDSKEEIENSVENLEPFTYGVQDGKIFYNTNEGIEEIPPRNKKSVQRIEGMIELRDELRELIRIQKIENYDLIQFEQQLQHVNQLYDPFVSKFGSFHSQENKLVFRNDDYYPLLCSTEIEVEDELGNIHFEKAEVFSHATIRPQKTITHVDNALEALQLSANTRQKVDFEYMQQLYNKSTEEIIHELGTEIFLNPRTNEYELASEYLSGDVKTKLATVIEEIDQGNTLYEENRIALEKIIPQDLTLADINYQIGTAWIPDEYYIEFLQEKLKLNDYSLKNIFKLEKNPSNKEYFISGKRYFTSPLATKTYGTSKKNAYELFEDLLNFKNTTVYKTVEVDDGTGDSKEKTVMNPEETLLCREKQELLRTEFKQWVEQSSIKRANLEEIYNDRFNRYVVRTYDGSSLSFGTMNKGIELRPHQKNAVQRIVTEGRGLLAHVVGSGKTLSMIAAGMKLKELGLVEKPLYLVPKSLIRPFGEEILRAYPDKKVLIATDQDFKKENRKQFISKVATGTYDAIVMGHTQFAKTPLSKERYEAFLMNELNTLKECLMTCEEDSHSFKAIKGELKQAEKRLKTQLNAMDRDRILDFEDLGVDFIFVDEAHMYKNLGVRTKLGNVAGISTTSANKSLDMLAKIQYIQEENNGRGVVFATGTPISNSMCELYTMNRYLAPDILEELDVSHFDDWQGVFGEVENKLEMTPEASGYRVRARFSKFHNIPELMTQFSRFADVQTADMLDLPTPNLNRVIIETKATPMQELKMEELAQRSEAIRDGLVSPSEDNMLKITSEARRMALDPRLLSDGVYGRQDSNKLRECVDNVYRLWNENSDTKAAQIIFSDIGTPSNKSFNVYDELKILLVEKGVPEGEIQFIHTASNDVKKEKLFKDVRTGNVRILLGSTEKLGTGVNVQNRLLAIHNLDCPWRPSDLEQRIGRIERQGNEFDEVYSFTYITKGTFDSYLYQIQEQKLTYITQIMSSKAISRSTDDVDELVVQASEVKALATGNPLLKERADLENDVRRLKLLKSNHYQQANSVKNEIAQAERLIPAYEKRLNDMREDLQAYQAATEKESFQLIIDEKVFTSEDKTSEVGQLLLTDIETLRITSTDLKELRQKTIATYNGFPVHFNGVVANSSDYVLKVQGKAEYSFTIKSDSALSPMIKLSHLNVEMEKSIERTTSLLRDEKIALIELSEQKNKPFDRIDELNEKQATLKLMDEAIELGMSLEEVKALKVTNKEITDNTYEKDFDMEL